MQEQIINILADFNYAYSKQSNVNYLFWLNG